MAARPPHPRTARARSGPQAMAGKLGVRGSRGQKPGPRSTLVVRCQTAPRRDVASRAPRGEVGSPRGHAPGQRRSPRAQPSGRRGTHRSRACDSWASPCRRTWSRARSAAALHLALRFTYRYDRNLPCHVRSSRGSPLPRKGPSPPDRPPTGRSGPRGRPRRGYWDPCSQV